MYEFNFTEEDLPLNACVCELSAPNLFRPDYHDYNLALIVIALPIIATFGIITNVFSFLIFTRGQLTMNSMHYYLAALAVSDFLVDWCGLFVIAVDSARRFDALLTKIHLMVIPYVLPLGYMAQMCSVYFTVCAAVDCYVSIRAPNSRFSERTKVTIYLVVFCSFVYNCVTFWDLEVVSCVDYKHDSEVRQEICPTSLRMDPFYMQLYKVYCYALFMAFVPFILLLGLNFLIIYSEYYSNRKCVDVACVLEENGNEIIVQNANEFVQNSRKDAADEMSHHYSSPHRSTPTATADASSSSAFIKPSVIADGSESSTITLVMVVVLFLICNSIGFAVNIIETFGSYAEQDVDAQIRLMFVVDAGNFLVVLNSSANFLIYVAFSKPFRHTLRSSCKKYGEKFTLLIASLKAPFTIKRRPDKSSMVALTLVNLLTVRKSKVKKTYSANQTANTPENDKLISNGSDETANVDENDIRSTSNANLCLIIGNRSIIVNKITHYQTCELLPSTLV